LAAAGAPSPFDHGADACGLCLEIACLVAQDPSLMLQIFGCFFEDLYEFLLVIWHFTVTFSFLAEAWPLASSGDE
jgi:hypothetical protein